MPIRAVIVRTLSTPEHKMPPTAVLAGVSRTCLCVASQQAVLRDNLLRHIRAILPPKGATSAVFFFKHDDTSRVTALPSVYLHSDVCHCCFISLCFGILYYSEPSSGSRKAQHSEEPLDGKTMTKQ